MRFNDISIKLKGLIISVFAIIIIFFSALSLFNSIHGVNTNWDRYHNEAVFRLRQLGEIKSQFGYGGFIHNFKNFVLRGQQKYIDRFNNNKTIMFTAIANLKRLHLSAQEEEAVQKIEGVATEYVKNIAIAARLVKEGKTPREIDHLVKINDSPAFQGFQVIKTAINALEAEHSSAMQKNIKSLSSTVIISFTSFVIILVILAWLLFNITQRLRQIEKFTKLLGQGDFTAQIALDSKDEVGSMAKNLNAAINSLNKMFAKNISTSNSLASASSEQASTLENTASALEEINSMTRQNASNVAEANSLTKEVEKAVDKAHTSMDNTTNSMTEIIDSSQETSKIIKTIDEIAFQTNLLALNAAVEAARAGEAGAGFAVVAEEVRSLAMRSAEAARNTSQIIEGTIHKVQEGARLVNSANEDFNIVQNNVTKVTGLINEIDHASEEQAVGIEELNKAVAEMDSVTQQNADSAEDLASSMSMFKVSGVVITPPEHTQPHSAARLNIQRPTSAAKPKEVIPMDTDDDFEDF